ncbi:hypothetical protein LZ30DRAFT_38692 [Colletotrichum cereale]|nr:hypothetical protein LZ30DRAFT_38692 [Colletotrichum cereale]
MKQKSRSPFSCGRSSTSVKAYQKQMVSSKYLTAFSDFRVGHDLPDFLAMADYVRYLEGYCSHFNLWDLIETRTEIIRVSRTPSGHRIFFRRMDKKSTSGTKDEAGEGESWDCDAIAVCSGLNNVPSIPAIQGLDGVQTLHSSEVKERQQFGTNTSVMILGAGETAMDLAHLAVTSKAREVTLCHKDGFFCAKKTLPLPVLLKKWKPDPRQKPVDTAIV